MTNKRIVYTTAEGETAIVVPSPKFNGTIEQLAKETVPEGLKWREITTGALPQSRNYRNAWTDANETQTVDIDLEKAKQVQRDLMVQKLMERTPKDELGRVDTAFQDKVLAEIKAIDTEKAKDLTELYNMFPASIDKRSGEREYVVHKESK